MNFAETLFNKAYEEKAIREAHISPSELSCLLIIITFFIELWSITP